jgi:hypothetical protein
VSAQLIWKGLKQTIGVTNLIDQDATGVQEPVDGKEILDPNHTSSVLTTILNTINKESQFKCQNVAVRLLNAHLIYQSTYECVLGVKDSIAGLPRTTHLAHQIWAACFILRRWD